MEGIENTVAASGSVEKEPKFQHELEALELAYEKIYISDVDTTLSG